MRHRLASLLGALTASVIIAACAVEAEPTRYGPPGGLSGKKLPGDNGGDPGGGGDDGGAPTLDAGPCSVSFKTQIMPKMTGAWQCSLAGSCHGTGGTPPLVVADATTTWNNFRNYKMKGSKKPYIDPTSTDLTKSDIVCNMKGEAGCGTKMPTTTTVPANEIAEVETWATCGAPNN